MWRLGVALMQSIYDFLPRNHVISASRPYSSQWYANVCRRGDSALASIISAGGGMVMSFAAVMNNRRNGKNW